MLIGIHSVLQSCNGKGSFPISLEKLEEENRALYDIIVKRIGKVS
jgi:hypothetical protein